MSKGIRFQDSESISKSSKLLHDIKEKSKPRLELTTNSENIKASLKIKEEYEKKKDKK